MAFRGIFLHYYKNGLNVPYNNNNAFRCFCGGGAFNQNNWLLHHLIDLAIIGYVVFVLLLLTLMCFATVCAAFEKKQEKHTANGHRSEDSESTENLPLSS